MLAHGLSGVIRAVHELHAVRHLDLPGIAEQRIHSRGRHGARGYLHARAGHFTALDGHFHVYIGVHGAFGFEVAERGEAMVERNARIARGEDGAVGDGLLQELRVVFLGGDVPVQKNVRVGVNKARENRGAGKVDELGAGGGRAARGDGYDFVPFHKNQGVGDRLLTLAVNEFARTNGNALRRLAPGWKQGENQYTDKSKQAAHHADLREERRKD